jgi:3',5'-cyclic AMP phosphodiesterase CpdA
MKIRKGLTLLCWLLLVLACVLVIRVIGTSNHAGGTGESETQTYETEAPSGDASGGENSQSEAPENSDKTAPEQAENQEDSAISEGPDAAREEQLARELEEARLRKEREEAEIRRKKSLWEKAKSILEKQKQNEEPEYVPPTIFLASDLHYISSTMHDGGRQFWKMVYEDDGKVSQYSEFLIDTLIQETLDKQPSALVLTGDITLYGERENHEGLAQKLQKLNDAGIQVLVIPGNHDINHPNSATYFGDEKEEAEGVKTADEFFDIYRSFGYDQALSRDPASLSYIYVLDDTHWMMMLDTCQYENGNKVNGYVRPDTLVWMEEELEVAKEEGVSVTVTGHHNLLSESRLYTTDCTMINHDDVTELLERYEVPLYISGHLHAQRIKKHKAVPGVPDDEYGITEIVLSPFSIPPCQYGSLSWDESGKMTFDTLTADVAAWYEANADREDLQGLSDDDKAFLEDFAVRGEAFVKEVTRLQVQNSILSRPDELKEQMAELYADLYYNYCAGNQMSWSGTTSTTAFRLWERLIPDSVYVARMKQMADDVRESQHHWAWNN